jgi:hypothetical protein
MPCQINAGIVKTLIAAAAEHAPKVTCSTYSQRYYLM